MDDATCILAFETSGRHGSVAALFGEANGSRLVREIVLGEEERTAQSLAPTIKRLLETVEWTPDSIKLVAVAVGPGSFTGLRIGVTTAKTFAYAIGAEVMGVNTLDALAAQSPKAASPLWTVLDAQRQELFAAKFVVNDGESIRTIAETSIIPQEEWVDNLRAGERVTGAAVGRLREKIPADVEIVSQDLWQPMAAAVGEVAWSQYQAGRRDDVWKLAPDYYRASAAEEKATRAT